MPAGSDQDRCVKKLSDLENEIYCVQSGVLPTIVFILVYYLQNMDTNYSFLNLHNLIIYGRIGKDNC